MKIRTFVVLFICTLVPLFIGMGLFPLLPLYAARFGATRTDVGIFYAVVYIASAASIIGTGWLVARVAPRRLFLAASVLGAPTMVLLGNATALWQVVLFTALAWMWGGMTLTLLNVFTGMLVDPARRGRIFSLMFLVYPLDALAGGTAVALLTRAYGYTAMFYVLAAVAAVQPLVGLIGLRGAQIVRPSAAEGPKRLAAPLGRPFALLLASSLLSIGCISIGRLGTSLAMQALGSSPEAIASTTIVSGLVTIPIVLAIGWVSDRVGRRGVLALSYLLAAAGTLLLAGAAQVWQFQIAATMLLAAWCVNRAVASALATDILPRDAIARGLSWLGSTDSIASIVGFAISGFVLDAFGAPVLFGAASALGLAAIAALTGLSKASRLGSPPDARVYATDRAAVASPGVSGKPS